EVEQNLSRRGFWDAFGQQAFREGLCQIPMGAPAEQLVCLVVFCNAPELSASLRSCLDAPGRVSEQSFAPGEDLGSAGLATGAPLKAYPVSGHPTHLRHPSGRHRIDGPKMAELSASVEVQELNWSPWQDASALLPRRSARIIPREWMRKAGQRNSR
ncbi:hypothetical protein MMC07_007975, partial [Pseudocyphellaria aurata]|nr:hypothetical protein [Pseudocyphellaria aurata]